MNVVRRNPDLFRVSALTAHTDGARLGAQAAEFKPDFWGLSGEGALDRAEAYDADVVMIAVTGVAGLTALINALKHGCRHIALANKEAVVLGGEYFAELADFHRKNHGANIIPVDSEHSAIFQCLRGDEGRAIKRVILTASGGPFLRRDAKTLGNATREDVLNHPTFKMGAKISVDSATMVNKGFEVAEAKFLFGLQDGQIDAVIHPQSIIHSMVEFTDGSTFAQMAYPDMEIPISYALTCPDRLAAGRARPLDFAGLKALTFEPLDEEQFPCFRLCRQAIRAGGVALAALLAADEEAVAAYLAGRIRFTQIYDIIDGVLNKIDNRAPRGLPDRFAAVDEGRRAARREIGKISRK